MKKLYVLNQVLFIVSTVAFIVGLSSCSKDDNMKVDLSNNELPSETRSSSRFTWFCDYCGYENMNWRYYCLLCHSENDKHKTFSTVLFDYIGSVTTFVTTIKEYEIDDYNVQNRIELPGGVFPEFAPTPWFESYKAQQYYNNLKTLSYYSDPVYAEAIDYAWYRTVRVLYPGYTNLTKVEKIYDKWLVNEGRNLRGTYGSGLKTGTKAAIEAFGACK